MTDYNCPECGSNLPPADRRTDYINCGWSGLIETAVIDTSSPFDVEGKPPVEEYGEDTGEVIIRLSKHGKPIQLSPNKAENFAEALNHAARDARGHRDP